MNRHQAVVLGVAAVNIMLMLLFPPYDALGMLRGGQSFDAFYFALDTLPSKVINWDMLQLEVYWVLANAALAWWLLRDGGTGGRSWNRRTVVILFAIANLALVFLFPPFENYGSTLRAGGTYFDGFYFLFGDKWQRHFHVPLLYLEVVWVLINAAVCWLLMRSPVPQASAEED